MSDDDFEDEPALDEEDIDEDVLEEDFVEEDDVLDDDLVDVIDDEIIDVVAVPGVLVAPPEPVEEEEEDDVVDLDERTWFDRAGNFHSDELHVVERYTMADADHIDYQATIQDPKVFTRPWKMSMVLYRRLEKGAQILEYECDAFEHPFHALESP